MFENDSCVAVRWSQDRWHGSQRRRVNSKEQSLLASHRKKGTFGSVRNLCITVVRMWYHGRQSSV